MAERPSLKLRLGSTSNFSNPPPPPDTPLTTSTPKLKLSFGGSKATGSSNANPIPTAAASTTSKKPKKDKPKRTPAPTAKKRALAASTLSDGDDDELSFDNIAEPPRPISIGKSKIKISSTSPPAPKKLKLSTKVKKTGLGLLKVKTPLTPRPGDLKKKLKIPTRPPGVGYDSEASDREIDPSIEEDFILRMHGATPEQVEELARAIEDRKIGTSVADGGQTFSIQFLHPQGRRALVKVGPQRYAATLVDLPCIIEGHKSWDRKTWYKGADICQMLLVLGAVENEEQCMDYTLPPDVNPTTWQYAQGVTPPMRNVRKRRFRERVSNSHIQRVEDEVDRLLQADAESVKRTRASVYDEGYVPRDSEFGSESVASHLERRSEMGDGTDMGDEGDEDAEGSIDERLFDQDPTETNFQGGDQEEDIPADDDLEADLERAMMEISASPEPDSVTNPHEASTTTATSTPAATPSFVNNPDDASSSAATPDAGAVSSSSSDEDASEVGDEEEEIDEDVLERQRFMQRQREEIADLTMAIKGEEAKLANVSNAIFRKKGLEKIRSLKEDLERKKDGIGEGGAEEDGAEA